MRNPEEMVANMLLRNVNNPMIKNLVDLAKRGEFGKVNDFAKNICKERGLDFEKELSNFIKNFQQVATIFIY